MKFTFVCNQSNVSHTDRNFGLKLTQDSAINEQGNTNPKASNDHCLAKGRKRDPTQYRLQSQNECINSMSISRKNNTKT